MTLSFPRATGRSWRRNPTQNSGHDESRRMYRWAELKQRMRYERQNKAYSWYDHREPYQESSQYERGPFGEVLNFTFFTLFLMKIIGYRASLTICSLIALLDKQLDAGYKMGYVIAWFMGGRGGILLSILIHFTSWLCGKNNSNLVAVVVVAMWIGANLARLAPVPQGAVLALLYMSIKLQVDLKWGGSHWVDLTPSVSVGHYALYIFFRYVLRMDNHRATCKYKLGIVEYMTL